MVQSLAYALGGVVAGTRPLVEKGWLDAHLQIRLSGRTVRPRLLITCGISCTIHFVAGMQDSECIISVNTDVLAPIMKVSSYALEGDLYEIIPSFLDQL